MESPGERETSRTRRRSRAPPPAGSARWRGLRHSCTHCLKRSEFGNPSKFTRAGVPDWVGGIVLGKVRCKHGNISRWTQPAEQALRKGQNSSVSVAACLVIAPKCGKTGRRGQRTGRRKHAPGNLTSHVTARVEEEVLALDLLAHDEAQDCQHGDTAVRDLRLAPGPAPRQTLQSCTSEMV